MAHRRRDRMAAWTERVDQLCDEGETVEHRVDLEGGTVAVTNRRVLAFTPDGDGPDFRHVDRPNVGTVTVETIHRLRWLCLAIVAAFVGVGLLEAAQAIDLTGLVSVDGLGGDGAVPNVDGVTRVAETALEGVETALLFVEWSVLALGVAALALAAVLVAAYVRSRSRRLVLRISGGDDLAIPVTAGAVENGVVTDLEAAIRPRPADGERAGRRGGDGAPDRTTADRLGREESG